MWYFAAWEPEYTWDFSYLEAIRDTLGKVENQEDRSSRDRDPPSAIIR